MNFFIKFVNKENAMNQRLQQFLSAEGLTQTQLADRLGVAKASVSHILAGRNKPGYDFIVSLSRQFPNLNLDWLINGKGRMYKITGQDGDISPVVHTTDQNREPQGGEIFEISQETAENQSDTPKIVKVVVFYDNGTFQEIV
ncbi:MAG: helix-turn-helix transcriptional regulator [Bacteroidales bacterium]|nr:helix-turn-helix transcriptional regulator [Bacteroidales bacterium]